MITERIREIKATIEAAAVSSGRSPDEIRIVAAAKTQPVSRIKEAIEAGITVIGHNYVQEAISENVKDRPAGVEIHMIGHLQRNKANKAVEIFDVIQTLDNERLAEALDRKAREINKTIGTLIQVNLAEEPQKSGIHSSELEGLISTIRKFNNLKPMGLMTMPPFFDDPENARPFFSKLRELRDSLIEQGVMSEDMTELSMGMTGDFEAAIQEGATLVRIGTALFGPRG